MQDYSRACMRWLPSVLLIGGVNIMKTKLFGFVASILLLAMLRLSAAAPVVLLTDNFTGTGTPDSLDLNYNLPGRQTGPLGLIGYTTDGTTKVGDPGEPHDSGNVLLTAGFRAALLYNFNSAKSAGGLKVGFDLDPNARSNGDTTLWGAVNLGAAWADRHSFVAGGATHFGILFRANGGIQAFDGGTQIDGGAASWTNAGNYILQLHHFDLVVTDPTDSNPFNGAGNFKIEVFVNGGTTPVFSWTKPDGDYTDNFINFQSADVANFDNLTITQIDPPAAPTEPWTFTPWSDDASSGVLDPSSGVQYTHAYNFSPDRDAQINNVMFTRSWGANPSVAGRFALTAPGNLANDPGTLAGNTITTGGSVNLARDFAHGGNPGSLVVQGLVPGRQYLLTMFSLRWDGQGGRQLTFSAGSDSRVIDQNAFGRTFRGGIAISYAYTADVSGTLTVTTTVLQGNPLHIYGFANREVATNANPWSYVQWNNDATSGINPGYTYTHAYTFGGAAIGTTINTVPFTAAPNANPAVATRFVTAGLGGVFGVDGGASVTGASSDLARSFVYNGFPSTFTIQGLTPGTSYVLSLFSTDWAGEAPGTRVISFSGAGGQRTIDQDAFGPVRNGIVISYAYTADASGAVTVQSSPLAGNSFHVYGFANRETTLTPVPVAITTQPRSLCLAAGQNAVFSVGAVGEPAPAYLWLKDGTPIVPSETGATLSLASITTANEGDYQVIVSNSVNSVTSAVATLTVGLAMINPSFEVDTFANFPGYVSGNGPITGWSSLGNHGVNSGAGPFADNGTIPNGAQVAFMQGDGAMSQTVSGFIIGEQYYVVYFENARNGGIPAIELQIGGTTIVPAHTRAPVGSGPYVEVKSDPFIATGTDLLLSFIKSNPLGGDTTALIDNVCVLPLPAGTPPSITRQPQAVVVNAGASVSFAVGALGSLPLSFQWRKDGADLLDATNNTLALNAVTASAEADYTVVVTNASGSVTSAVARLTVYDPIFTLFNTGLDTNRIALADGSIDPHYTLLSNPDTGSTNAIVEDSTAFPIVGGPWLANTASSKWIGPQLNTGGSAVGFYTNRTTFDLTNRDLSTVIIIGGWATDNTGRDILVNGVSIAPALSGGFGGYTGFVISTSNASFLPGLNTIDFVVENETSPGYTGLRVEFTTSNARILPNVPPDITIQPISQPAVIESNSVTFTVAATGTDPLLYQWSKDGTPLPGQTNTTLTLLNVTTNDNGLYTVRATNDFGFEDSIPATLAVIYRRVPGIYGTGLNNDGTLAADSSIDLHWILGSSSDLTNAGPDAFVINQAASPVGPWLAAGPGSKWIAPQPNQNAGSAEGNYTYQTFFDLSGVDLCTFRLAGQIAVDNTLVDIVVNGVSQGVSGGGFTSFLPFTVTNGFVAGPNTVDFVINNAPTGANPTAVRVDLDGLVRIRTITAPTLSITRLAPDTLSVSWTPTGDCDRLQSAPDVTGPWTTVGTLSPATVYTTNGPATFFRVLP